MRLSRGRRPSVGGRLMCSPGHPFGGCRVAVSVGGPGAASRRDRTNGPDVPGCSAYAETGDVIIRRARRGSAHRPRLGLRARLPAPAPRGAGAVVGPPLSSSHGTCSSVRPAVSSWGSTTRPDDASSGCRPVSVSSRSGPGPSGRRPGQPGRRHGRRRAGAPGRDPSPGRCRGRARPERRCRQVVDQPHRPRDRGQDVAIAEVGDLGGDFLRRGPGRTRPGVVRRARCPPRGRAREPPLGSVAVRVGGVPGSPATTTRPWRRPPAGRGRSARSRAPGRCARRAPARSQSPSPGPSYPSRAAAHEVAGRGPRRRTPAVRPRRLRPPRGGPTDAGWARIFR